jgi:hypothetical protein
VHCLHLHGKTVGQAATKVLYLLPPCILNFVYGPEDGSPDYNTTSLDLPKDCTHLILNVFNNTVSMENFYSFVRCGNRIKTINR